MHSVTRHRGGRLTRSLATLLVTGCGASLPLAVAPPPEAAVDAPPAAAEGAVPPPADRAEAESARCESRVAGGVTLDCAAGRVFLAEQIEFEVGSDRLAPGSYPLLAELIGVLDDAPALRIGIQGHLDREPEPQHALRLGHARAESVRRHLIAGGIAADRLAACGFGDSAPVAGPRSDPIAAAINRRVDIVVREPSEDGCGGPGGELPWCQGFRFEGGSVDCRVGRIELARPERDLVRLLEILPRLRIRLAGPRARPIARRLAASRIAPERYVVCPGSVASISILAPGDSLACGSTH